jgi:non-ribosomal peptide synthetase component F
LREPLIGLMADAGPDLVVGLLGILKSGAAFVPLSPAQPHERIAMIAADCGIEVLVTERRYLESSAGTPGDGDGIRPPPAGPAALRRPGVGSVPGRRRATRGRTGGTAAACTG